MAVMFAWTEEARRTGGWCALTPSGEHGSSARSALLTPEVRHRSRAHKPRDLACYREHSRTVLLRCNHCVRGFSWDTYVSECVSPLECAVL